MNFWKWSIGEAYYKSARTQNNNNDKNADYNNDKNTDYINTQEYYDSPSQAINNALNDNDLINLTNSIFSRNQNNLSNRREDLDNKMSDRDKISQRGINPFLQNSYVNDVVTRDIFLKPINTTQGMHKINETETNT